MTVVSTPRPGLALGETGALLAVPANEFNAVTASGLGVLMVILGEVTVKTVNELVTAPQVLLMTSALMPVSR